MSAREFIDPPVDVSRTSLLQDRVKRELPPRIYFKLQQLWEDVKGDQYFRFQEGAGAPAKQIPAGTPFDALIARIALECP